MIRSKGLKVRWAAIHVQKSRQMAAEALSKSDPFSENLQCIFPQLSIHVALVCSWIIDGICIIGSSFGGKDLYRGVDRLIHEDLGLNLAKNVEDKKCTSISCNARYHWVEGGILYKLVLIFCEVGGTEQLLPQGRGEGFCFVHVEDKFGPPRLLLDHTFLPLAPFLDRFIRWYQHLSLVTLLTRTLLDFGLVTLHKALTPPRRKRRLRGQHHCSQTSQHVPRHAHQMHGKCNNQVYQE